MSMSWKLTKKTHISPFGKQTPPDESKVIHSHISLPSVTAHSHKDTLSGPSGPANTGGTGSSTPIDSARSSSSTLALPKSASSKTLTQPINGAALVSSSGPPGANLTSSQIKTNLNNNSLPAESLPTDAKSTSTLRPGLLTVSIKEASGLSLPPGYAKPESRNKSSSSSVGNSNNTSSSSTSSSTPARPPPVYLVLEFDKTQVVLDATSGSLENPVWDSVANFDVSRAETLSIQIYAKVSRGSEVFLGSHKISDPQTSGGWLTLTSGTGKIHVNFRHVTKSRALTIEDFDLLKVVGKGSFGKVMQVRKRDTQRIYALKTIRKAHIVSRSEVNHTLAERTVLAQINNPFIVPLKFSFQSPEKLYLVLAFINGGELFHHLQREGRFDLNRARFYTAELLCALECLHEYNVIYRDLKPENILLDYTGHIALCDFGLCKLNMAGQEKTNTFCGTPEYLAPELLLGQGYTKVVDWWTLGVLFYEMLTGLPPFYDENTNDMYRKILQEPLRFPEDMDREARSLLTGLLNRDPKLRLGVNGAAEIKGHAFFAQIDWKRLMSKKYAAPFKPLVESATDTSNFDQEFTSEIPTDSVSNDYLSDSVQKQFGGWTYTDSRGWS